MTFKKKNIAVRALFKKLGYETFLYCPKGDNPAEYSVNEYINGNWDDKKKLETFASKVDVITSEFENIPAKTLDNLSKITKVYPSSLCFINNGRIFLSQYS